MFKNVKTFVKKYLKYLRNRILQYLKHDNLQSLRIFLKLFYTVTINLIINLLENKRFLEEYKYNLIIIITYYFLKTIAFVLDKKNWDA